MATIVKTTPRKAPIAPAAPAAPTAKAAPAPIAAPTPKPPAAPTAPKPPAAPQNAAATAPTDKARREDKRAARAARDSFIATSSAPAALRALASVLAPRPAVDELFMFNSVDWRDDWSGVIATLHPCDDPETPIVSVIRALCAYPGAADPNPDAAAHALTAGWIALWDTAGIVDASGAPYRVRDGGPAYVTTLLGYVREDAFLAGIVAAGENARAVRAPDVLLAAHVAAAPRPAPAAAPPAPANAAPAAPVKPTPPAAKPPAAIVKPPARPVPPARAR